MSSKYARTITSVELADNTTGVSFLRVPLFDSERTGFLSLTTTLTEVVATTGCRAASALLLVALEMKRRIPVAIPKISQLLARNLHRRHLGMRRLALKLKLFRN